MDHLRGQITPNFPLISLPSLLFSGAAFPIKLKEPMWLLRKILGFFILTWERMFRPKGVERAPANQATLDAKCKNVIMYQFLACPFCVKVRRELDRNSLTLELRDAQNDPKFKQELTEQGGKWQTPCLRITQSDGKVEWLYESDDIIDFIHEKILDRPQQI